MIKTVRVHTCNQKYEGYLTEKCGCRKFVTQEKAEQLKDDGYAANVVISRKTVDIEVKCPICEGDNRLRKSCRVCSGTGTATVQKDIDELGEDIYMRPVLKTPRTATIEAKHLEYAYIRDNKDAAKRIELYHESDQLALVKLGAQLRDSNGNILFDGTPEPEDDPKTGQGRKHDYGRTI